MNFFLVVICKNICRDLFGLLITGKFMPPQVLLFESPAERFHVAVLFRCVFPDEFVFCAECWCCLSKIITDVLRAVVGSESQSRTIRVFYRYSICYGVNCPRSYASTSNMYDPRLRVKQHTTLKQ